MYSPRERPVQGILGLCPGGKATSVWY